LAGKAGIVNPPADIRTNRCCYRRISRLIATGARLVAGDHVEIARVAVRTRALRSARREGRALQNLQNGTQGGARAE
jgi:hypothetical protein